MVTSEQQITKGKAKLDIFRVSERAFLPKSPEIFSVSQYIFFVKSVQFVEWWQFLTVFSKFQKFQEFWNQLSEAAASHFFRISETAGCERIGPTAIKKPYTLLCGKTIFCWRDCLRYLTTSKNS